MLIAVAGPYSAATEEQKAANLKAMNIAAAKVFRKGHIPVVGFNASLKTADEFTDDKRELVISKISFAVVDKCDAILVIGSSPGADYERDLFIKNGRPVYYSLDEIPEIR